jgi:phage tail P2-like protein
MVELKKLSFVDILPPNLASDETLRAAALALDGELQAVTELTRLVVLLARLDELDDATVDMLAKQFKVDFYDAGTELTRKRELVRRSIAWHRTKGTPGAVQSVVDVLLDGATVSEYWEYDGKPYHFKVGGMTGPLVDGNTILKVGKAIQVAKNTRSHLDSISFDRKLTRTLHVGSAIQVNKTIVIKPVPPADVVINTALHVGSAIQVNKEVIINAKLG